MLLPAHYATIGVAVADAVPAVKDELQCQRLDCRSRCLQLYATVGSIVNCSSNLNTATAAVAVSVSTSLFRTDAEIAAPLSVATTCCCLFLVDC